MDKQDESAADVDSPLVNYYKETTARYHADLFNQRRRTQIRMAQRAYRQRKESTLDELRKRVSDLTNTIELMNKSFLDFQQPRSDLRAFASADQRTGRSLAAIRAARERRPEPSRRRTVAGLHGRSEDFG